MFKQFMLVVLLITSAQSAFASAMSDSRSRCLRLQGVAAEHNVWKVAYRQFQENTTLNSNQRFDLLRSSLNVVMNRLKLVQILSGREDQNRRLIYDTLDFLTDLNRGDVTRPTAQRLMTSAMRNFEDAIDDALFRAQSSNQECTITPGGGSSLRPSAPSESGR